MESSGERQPDRHLLFQGPAMGWLGCSSWILDCYGLPISSRADRVSTREASRHQPGNPKTYEVT